MHRLTEAKPEGWIVGNGDGSRWRVWKDGLPDWTDDPKLATRFARREDAEAVHAEDEGAWTVVTFDSTQPKKHEWFVYNGWWCCANCGIIKNETSDLRACKGHVRVGPRRALQDKEG